MQIISLGSTDLEPYQLEQLDLRGEFSWLCYTYEYCNFEGSGELAAYHPKYDRVYVTDLGHNSCYGPCEGSLWRCRSYRPQELIDYADNVTLPIGSVELFAAILPLLHQAVADREAEEKAADAAFRAEFPELGESQ